MKKTSQRKMLEILYDSGFDFKVTENSIEVLNGTDSSDKLVFTFDEDEEDLIDISGNLSND